MILNQYELTSDEQATTFEFISEGPKGKIEKLIRFELVPDGYYNLAFGDKDPLTGDLDDKVVTNNGDSDKVLATVGASVYIFCKKFPDAWIYATGSTPARTRLYAIGINKYYEAVKGDFILLGQTLYELELYEKGKNYIGFLVQRKMT